MEQPQKKRVFFQGEYPIHYICLFYSQRSGNYSSYRNVSLCPSFRTAEGDGEK